MTYWVNVYRDGFVGVPMPSREEAAENAFPVSWLVYRIKVTLKGKA